MRWLVVLSIITFCLHKGSQNKIVRAIYDNNMSRIFAVISYLPSKELYFVRVIIVGNANTKCV